MSRPCADLQVQACKRSVPSAGRAAEPTFAAGDDFRAADEPGGTRLACGGRKRNAAPNVTVPMIPEGGVDLPAWFSKPDGAGPFPAVLLLHGCHGLVPIVLRTSPDWASFLNAHGYATLIVDSFTPRDLHLICSGRADQSGSGRNVLGHAIRYDAQATRREILDFFGTYLRD
jgi:hypothetical protein